MLSFSKKVYKTFGSFITNERYLSEELIIYDIKLKDRIYCGPWVCPLLKMMYS